MATTYFIIKGIDPPGLSSQPESVRLMFWNWVVELGLKRKDRELSQGLNASGGKLPSVRLGTRKHRRSAMTPTGKGDPSAPYLMPGRRLSRTRSLLSGKAHTNYAEFFWRYDPWSGDQWGKILAIHARRGAAYNVVGLSERGIQIVAREVQARWRRWLTGEAPVVAPVTGASGTGAGNVRGRDIRQVQGSTDLTYATFGIGVTREQAQRAINEGRASGLMTIAEWEKHFRSKAAAIPTAKAPSVRTGSSNVILQHIWSQAGPTTTTATTATTRRAAMRPKAKVKPKTPKAEQTRIDAARRAAEIDEMVRARKAEEARILADEAQRRKPAADIDLHTVGDVTRESADEIRNVLAKLPEHVRRRLKAFGSEFVYAGKIDDVMTADEVGRRPRGYVEGSTWANAGGAYIAPRKSAVSCRTYVDRLTNKTVVRSWFIEQSTALHEAGHAVDHAFDYLSKSESFLAAYRKDVEAVASKPESVRAEMAYFLQSGEAGPSEAFAELTAVLHGRTRFAEMLDVFANTAKWMKDFFDGA